MCGVVRATQGARRHTTLDARAVTVARFNAQGLRSRVAVVGEASAHPTQEEPSAGHVALQVGALQLRTRGLTVDGAEHSRGARSSKLYRVLGLLGLLGLLVRCAQVLRLTVAAWEAGAQLLDLTQKKRPTVAVDGAEQRNTALHCRNIAAWIRRSWARRSGASTRGAGVPGHINRTRLETIR